MTVLDQFLSMRRSNAIQIRVMNNKEIEMVYDKLIRELVLREDFEVVYTWDEIYPKTEFPVVLTVQREKENLVLLGWLGGWSKRHTIIPLEDILSSLEIEVYKIKQEIYE